MAIPTMKRRVMQATAAMASIALLASCGGGGDGDAEANGGEGEVANEINLTGIFDTTGPIAYAGVGASRGIQLAIDQIEEEGFLGDDVTINYSETDTANEIERATSEVNRAISDESVNAIFGPVASQQAAAVAPMAEEAGAPIIFNQAGSEGVVIGDYTFRGTAPMETYYDIAAEHLADEGLTDVVVLYNATFPTFAELGENAFPELAEEHGLNIVDSYAAQDNTQDFTSQAQSITSTDPDAVVMLLIAPQSVTALQQLGQAGYDGQITATSVQAAGNVTEAGSHAEGLIYPVDFSPAQEGEMATDFVEAYTEEYGEAPDQYAAEGYDSMWWVARGIEASGDSSREGIQQGMQQLTEEGFEGVMGDLEFEGNDIRVPGVLVEWDGSEEHLVSAD